MSGETIPGEKAALLTAGEGVEHAEPTKPWKAVERAGGAPEPRHEAQAASA